MVNMMGLFLELMTNPLIIISKCIVLFKFCCLLGGQIFMLASTTWLLLVKAVIKVQVDLCWSAMIWTFSVISLPSRILTALQREKMLETKLHEMQTQLDNLTWENNELQQLLSVSFKERREIETVLAEMEQEQDKALAKIDLLEKELQELKDENAHMSEFRGKRLWDNQGGQCHDKSDGGVAVGTTNYGGIPSSLSSSSCPSGYNGSSRLTVPHDVLMRAGEAWYDESKSNNNKPPSKRKLSLGAGPVDVVSYQLRPSLEGLVVVEEAVAMRQQRYVAFWRSVFSAILSLLVGMIIWEAEDPCVPLVAALFTVVGMSLSSVVHFFSTIKNKPASDAVALLSVNWFVLGTLTSPTLPRVARVLAPPALRYGGHLLARLGLSSLN